MLWNWSKSELRPLSILKHVFLSLKVSVLKHLEQVFGTTQTFGFWAVLDSLYLKWKMNPLDLFLIVSVLELLVDMIPTFKTQSPCKPLKQPKGFGSQESLVIFESYGEVYL